MKAIDATPPADFPAQVIVMDKALAQHHPDKVFYLRLSAGDDIDHVALDGAITPLDARRMAREKGFEPTHWMVVDDARVTIFY